MVDVLINYTTKRVEDLLIISTTYFSSNYSVEHRRSSVERGSFVFIKRKRRQASENTIRVRYTSHKNSVRTQTSDLVFSGSLIEEVPNMRDSNEVTIHVPFYFA